MLSLTISLVNIYRERVKMTTRSSSSRGRGRGKQILNELPIVNQKGSSTLNQSGSSTQPTQPIQNQSSILKQTKSDYAFPVQTLFAFQEQGLINLPTKTWASIAEEDSDQDITTLDLAIQNQKNKIIQSNPRPSQIVPAQTQILPAQTQYIPKDKFFLVTYLEPEYLDENPNKIPSKIFPPQFHFVPQTPNKTQLFYEFVLIDTESVSIKHYKDTRDDSNITHSTL